MIITAEEELMYRVMKAIYDSGIPINFKGAMVLKACLLEAGYPADVRHTMDIDANWYSDNEPSPEQMVESMQSALEKSDIRLTVRLYRMYGEGRSAGFELCDETSDEVLFTMDVDVNRPPYPTKIYEVNGVKFCGVSPSQMIADKVSVVSSDKIFRRIKDLVDLYYFSKVFDFDKNTIIETMDNSGRKVDSFDGFLHRKDELVHSYDKFRFTGGADKPPFDEIYSAVKGFIKDILPREKSRGMDR